VCFKISKNLSLSISGFKEESLIRRFSLKTEYFLEDSPNLILCFSLFEE